MLLGGAVWLNHELNQQLSYDFDSFAQPSQNWFAIEEGTAAPVEVKFINPLTGEAVETVTAPDSPTLRFYLRRADTRNSADYLVTGANETSDPQAPPLGIIKTTDLINAVSNLDYQKVGTVYGTKRLYLLKKDGVFSKEGEAPDKSNSTWSCEDLPFEIEAVRYYQRGEGGPSMSAFRLKRCDESEVEDSKLANHEGKLYSFTIKEQQRTFLIAVISADHEDERPWSRFFAAEIERVRQL